MVKYNEVYETFNKQCCVLLMTEDEFNKKPRTNGEKYKFIASCKHNHEVRFSDFKSILKGLICPKCVIKRKSIKYIEIKKEFEKHNCILLMTEEEFNQESRTVSEKYKYTASCKHQHEIMFKHFKDDSQGRICPDCSNIKKSVDKIEQYKLNPVLPNELEYNSIEYFKMIIGDKFDVKFNSEACLSDCCIKPKHITEDLWLMVQMKSTAKPGGSYKFVNCSNYTNCIIMCICECDKKMWVFDGNININTESISIGTTKSKNDEFEITKDTIHEILTHYYNTFPLYDFETTDIPISLNHKLEWEYRKFRETTITCLQFIRNERQGLVYDFIVNGLKVQEKVNSIKKGETGTGFTLKKSNGSINHIKQWTSYKTGDNDFYWLNVNNKQHFYVIPEHELISRKYIDTDKKTVITLNPASNKKCKNSWTNEYLFDYTKLDGEKLKKMFNL